MTKFYKTNSVSICKFGSVTLEQGKGSILQEVQTILYICNVTVRRKKGVNTIWQSDHLGSLCTESLSTETRRVWLRPEPVYWTKSVHWNSFVTRKPKGRTLWVEPRVDGTKFSFRLISLWWTSPGPPTLWRCTSFWFSGDDSIRLTYTTPGLTCFVVCRLCF